jgi:hypothetical protein
MMQRRQWWWCEVVACVLVSVLPLRAQPQQDPTSRPLEIGIAGGGEVSPISSGGDLRLNLTVPRSERRALEFFVGGYRGSNDFDLGVYGFQVRRPMAKRRRPGVEPFVTLGVMGFFDRFEASRCRDGGCRAERSFRVFPPVLGLIGVGAQYTIRPRLAVRVESQAAMALIIPVGFRFAAGVSMPLGGATFRHSGR